MFHWSFYSTTKQFNCRNSNRRRCKKSDNLFEDSILCCNYWLNWQFLCLSISWLIMKHYFANLWYAWQVSVFERKWATDGWDRLASLRHAPANFNGFRIFTSLNGGQPNFAWRLVVSCAGTLCIHLGGSCPCQVQNSLCVQVLRSPILAALLHSTRAVGVSQTLQRGTRNRIMELSLLVIFNRGRQVYSEGGHHVGHIGPHSSLSNVTLSLLISCGMKVCCVLLVNRLIDWWWLCCVVIG